MISQGFSTRCIHAGTIHEAATGGACSPVYPSTAFTFPNATGQSIYPRYFNTLNQKALADKIAALEGGEGTLVFGSGMAAISTTPCGPEPVRHKPSERAFLTTSGARLEYQQPAADELVVTHTFVPETLRGQGTAARLMEALLDHARRKGIVVTATCDYARAYLERKEIQQG